jgi:cytochrome P450
MTKWGRETIVVLEDYEVGVQLMHSGVFHMRYLTHSLQKYLQAMIDERKALRASGQVPNDVLSNIVASNEDHHDGNIMSLSDEEMRGSPCLFLGHVVIEVESTTGTCVAIQGAGHETTAHSLDLIFRLLALHPEVQEELYRNIQAVKTDATPLVSTTTF